MTIKTQIQQPADAAALAAVHAACFAPAWDAAAIEALLGIPGTVAVTAEGRGFALLRSLGAEAEILTLCVLPAQRRQGVAAALLAHAQQWARQVGVGQLFLEVRESNAAAIALYAQAGFERLTRRRDYYRTADGGSEDAVVLRWRA